MRGMSVKGAVLVVLWLTVSAKSVAVDYDYVHDPTHEGSITAGKVMTWQASPPGTIITWKVLNTGDIGWIRQTTPKGAFKTTVKLSHTAGYHKGEFDGTYTVPGAGDGDGEAEELTWYGSSDATVVYVASVTPTPAVIEMTKTSSLDAKPDPAGAAWPGGKPVWDRRRTAPEIKDDPLGNWAFSGIGDPMTMTFLHYGRWEVRAACGNQKTAEIDVIDITLGNAPDRVYLKDEFRIGFTGWAAGNEFDWTVEQAGLADVTQISDTQARFNALGKTSNTSLVTKISASYTAGNLMQRSRNQRK